MKNAIVLLIMVITLVEINAQTIYTKTFGNPKNEPIIYLHGGPGYNSVSFEITTAKKLSESGYYVIVYDRRGEGRSLDKAAEYTFKQTFSDLDIIYKKLNIKKATLLGHSFGGIVATLFAEKYPEKAKSIILVGAPIALQETYSTILKTSKAIYINKKDSVNLNYIQMLENMDKNSLMYSAYSFMHAMQNGFYSAKHPTEEALAIYSKFKTDTTLIKYSKQMTYEGPKGFWENEKYTTIDLTRNLKDIQKYKIKVFGLYGKEDGLYSKEQVQQLKELLGNNNFEYLDDCSHNVFIDQQIQFISAIKKWIK